ncbi:hypothetical protein Ciccas_009998 [Cichlidogyrus casuarinus]|uniref:C2H2-type domain-containing protein n=1 Tax=Cichlidogyrus casuarinus TaxID=1844966 RepID=A0ABD2PVY1_9PLAT
MCLVCYTVIPSTTGQHKCDHLKLVRSSASSNSPSPSIMSKSSLFLSPVVRSTANRYVLCNSGSEQQQQQIVIGDNDSPPIILVKSVSHNNPCSSQMLPSSSGPISLHMDDDLQSLEELASIETSKTSQQSPIESACTSPALSLPSDRLSLLGTPLSMIGVERPFDPDQLGKRRRFSQGIVCEDCCNGRVFYHASQYYQHRKNTHSNVVYNCDQCNRAFTTKGNLNKHFEHVHNKCHNQVCPYCHERLANKSVLLPL